MQHAILTLDQGGRPSRWSTWEEALLYQVKGLVAWGIGDETAIRGGICRRTGEETIVRVPNIIAVKNETFAGRVAFTNRNLFARDDHICCYCGDRFPVRMLSREHIVPVSRGGANSWMNCATACTTCNGAKGARLPEEAGMKLLYLPYVPSPVESLILAGRNIQADQMEFLRNCLPASSRLHERLAA